jgi:hypothetical protein
MEQKKICLGIIIKSNKLDKFDKLDKLILKIIIYSNRAIIRIINPCKELIKLNKPI